MARQALRLLFVFISLWVTGHALRMPAFLASPGIDTARRGVLPFEKRSVDDTAGPRVTCLRESHLYGRDEQEVYKATDETCNSAQMTELKGAYVICAERAKAAAEATANATRDDMLQLIFNHNATISEEFESNRTLIAQRFMRISNACSKAPGEEGTTPITCGCDEEKNKTSNATTLGVTLLRREQPMGTSSIKICNSAFNKTGTGCSGLDLPDVVLHEMAHSWCRVNDTGYGIEKIEKLSKADSLDNADSYTRFAKIVYLGCNETQSKSDAEQKAKPSTQPTDKILAVPQKGRKAIFGTANSISTSSTQSKDSPISRRRESDNSLRSNADAVLAY